MLGTSLTGYFIVTPESTYEASKKIVGTLITPERPITDQPSPPTDPLLHNGGRRRSSPAHLGKNTSLPTLFASFRVGGDVFA
jgi:hypothetical protein